MTRVHQSKANKEYRCGRAGCGRLIQKGETYYSFALYRQRRQMRCVDHRPLDSETAGNEKLQLVYAAREAVEAAAVQAGIDGEIGDLVQAMRDAADEVRQAGDLYRESFDSLPENFQASDQGQALEQGQQDCESYADELERTADEIEADWPGEVERDENDDVTDESQELVNELIGRAEGVECPL